MKDTKRRPPLYNLFSMAIGISPILSVSGILWITFAIDRHRFAWTEDFAIASMLTGTAIGAFGGLLLAAVRQNAWWLLVAIASVVLGFLEIHLLLAMGMSQVH